MKERYEFDEGTPLSAFVMGVPGKRTFFLIIGQKEEWVRVWLEKEQLETLALAIDQFLLTLSQKRLISSREVEGTTLSDDVPSGLPSAELEIDQITLGFDQGRATLNFLVHALGPQKIDQAVLNCQATLAQLKKLANQAKVICAAGRPRCIVCGGPIDPAGHICPMNN
ncbi:MAG: DUF3090 family protein [Chloroflexi bacterium]|nr:DUF3090 family protein [Chloroflexota bacterium]